MEQIMSEINVTDIFKTISQQSSVRESLDGYNKLMAYYRCAIMEIETKFNVLNEEFSLRYDRNPINSIKSRLKSIESIAGKLERKSLDITLANVENALNDVAGIRVVCSFESDVYLLAKAHFY